MGSSKDLKFAFDLANGNVSVLEELAEAWRLRRVRPSGDLAGPLRQLLGQKNSEIQIGACNLAGAWGLVDNRDEITRLARNGSGAIPVRSAAVAALAEIDPKGSRKILEELAGPRNPLPLQAAAIAGLCRLDPEDAARRTAKLLPRISDPAPLLQAFLRRENGSKILAAALERGALPKEAAERCLSALHAAGRSDKELATALRKAAGVTGKVPPYSPEFVSTLAKEVEKGDPENGKRIFRSKVTGCTACHRIEGNGGAIGPDLSGVGTGVPLDRLITEVIWPDRHVKEGYALLRIRTRSGNVLQGYPRKTRDAGKDLVLLDASTGTLRRIPRKDISAQKEGGTAMPTGLVAGLSRAELRDLISYLSSLGTQR